MGEANSATAFDALSYLDRDLPTKDERGVSFLAFFATSEIRPNTPYRAAIGRMEDV